MSGLYVCVKIVLHILRFHVYVGAYNVTFERRFIKRTESH